MPEIELQQLREAEDRVQRRAQLVAHARQKLRLRLAFALGQQRLLAREFGVAGLGDVPVHADAAVHRAVDVLQRGRARGEPAVAAVGPPDAELAGRRTRAVFEFGVGIEHQRAIVGVREREPFLAVQCDRPRGKTAQLPHLRVPQRGSAVVVGFPGADSGVARDQRGTFAGGVQRIDGFVAFGHVNRDAEHARSLGVAAVKVGAQHHPAHPAVALPRAKLDLERFGLTAQEGVYRVRHPHRIVGVNALPDPVAERRWLAAAGPVEERVHLRVPLGLAAADHARPNADARRVGRGLRAMRELLDAARLLHACGHIERDADESDHLARGVALDDAAHQHVAPHAVAAAVTNFHIDRHAGGQRMRCRISEVLRIVGWAFERASASDKPSGRCAMPSILKPWSFYWARSVLRSGRQITMSASPAASLSCAAVWSCACATS